MSLSTAFLQPRFARNLGSSFRTSPAPTTGDLPRTNDAFDDDFVDVSRDDLPIQLDSPRHAGLELTNRRGSHTLSFLRRKSTAPTPSQLENRPPQSLLNRIRNNSRPSVAPHQLAAHRKAFKLSTLFSSRSKLDLGLSDIVADFPSPPTHIPTPAASLYEAYSRGTSIDQSVAISIYSANLSQPSSATSVSEHPIPSPQRRRPSRNQRRSTLSSPSNRSQASSVNRLKYLAKQFLETPVSDISGGNLSALSHQPFLFADAQSDSLAAAKTPSTAAPPPPTAELVSPLDLTASPAYDQSHIFSTPATARASFIPPSPSWLSRNVPEAYKPTEHSPASSPELVTPTSPLPIPIPPRIFVERTNDRSPDNLSEHTLIGSVEGLPPSPAASVRTFSSNNSFRTSASQHSLRSDKENHNRYPANTLLKPPRLHTTNPSDDHLSPTPEAYPSPPSTLLQLPSTVFQSTRDRPSITIPADSFQPDLSALPIDVDLSLRNLGEETTAMDYDYSGKRNDVVDFGGEVNYEGMQWFQNAPPRPAPPEPAAPARHFEPPPQVIAQNETFEYALRVAPNVLYSRFKQYGQLGVLGWCSELSEMIDGLKELGFAGNMFVTTRTQALKTCEEILALKLPIEMQIIVMYLSSQVARLRRFLDGERQWDDYPEPQFPIDPRHYSS